MKKESSTHVYSLDLLRMVSMFMIVLTHVLGKGGLRDAVEDQFDWYYGIVWVLQILAYIAVNCYALLSGYVGVASSAKISKIALLWLQVFFYSFLMTLAFRLIGYQLEARDWVNAIFPIVTSQYWYVTAYFGLLIFKPLLNKGLASLADKELKQLVIAIFIVFSLMPALFNHKVLEYSLSKGFGMTWLIILYIFGAYLRRLDLRKYKASALLALYLLASVVTFVAMHLVGRIWYWYPSPSLVIASIAVFILFAKWDISEKKGLVKIVKVMAPATLGVYLIHLHPLVEKYLLTDQLVALVQVEEWLFPLAILMLAFGIYLVTSLIEVGRISLFKSLAVPKWVKNLDNDN